MAPAGRSIIIIDPGAGMIERPPPGGDAIIARIEIGGSHRADPIPASQFDIVK
jgi:hypothetical protein